jgi:hypothetical protein
MNIPSAILNINISILMDLITPRQSGQLILVHYVIPQHQHVHAALAE